jgi:large subunit ribosomal protein L12
MEYVYAALILNETGEEINESNLTDVLEAAGASVSESRVKALVAALEDVDIDQAVEEAAAVPAAGGAGGAPAVEGETADAGGDEEEEAGGDEAEDAGGDDEEAAGGDDEDEGADGEGLGELFG